MTPVVNKVLFMDQFHQVLIFQFYLNLLCDIYSCLYLGIEFYLFVSHGGMNDRGSTCKFLNARSVFRNLHMDPLSFIPA